MVQSYFDNGKSRMYEVEYTVHDLILYALGIGCGSLPSCPDHNKEERKFIYENEPNGFEVFPTFLLALGFRAVPMGQNDDHMPKIIETSRLPAFPPPSIRDVYTKLFVGEGKEVPANIKEGKALHISEKYRLHHHTIPIPYKNSQQCQIVLRSYILSVSARSIGTFVTTETHYYHRPNQNNKDRMILLATSQTKMLWLGLVPKNLDEIRSSSHKINKKNNGNKKVENKSATISSLTRTGHDMKRTKKKYHDIITLQIPKNQALLYRLSGDTNDIHVIGLSQDEDQTMPPILHGLCTLGIITRQILLLKHTNNGAKMTLRSIECTFIKPVFIEDYLQIETYYHPHNNMDHSLSIQFRAFTLKAKVKTDAPKKNNDMERNLVVDRGIIELESKNFSDHQNISRL